MREDEEILNSCGITPTPVRLLVFNSLRGAKMPMSLADIETELESVDKSTISRTLTIFKENHLVHYFNDGSGATKYELSYTDRESGNIEAHVHFRCEKCGKTECLHDLPIPSVELPEGYILNSSNYIISGLCNICNGKQR